MEQPSAPQAPVWESVPELEKIVQPSNPPKKEKFGFYIFIVFLFSLLVGGALAFYVSLKSTPVKTNACTMEAKICPDGSSVGRTGPNCEFSPCP